MEKTLKQYDSVLQHCRELFVKKTKDYGTAWRILRASSLTDQMFIKASRIRSIEEKGVNKVQESIEGEYIALVNYSLMALIQLNLDENTPLEMDLEAVLARYDQEAETAKKLMMAKNHDYGEAWRDMRISSITDLILMKILRIRQIEDNKGKTLVSEGLDANYQDINVYAIFALIRLGLSEK